MPSMQYQPLPRHLEDVFAPIRAQFPRALRRIQRAYATSQLNDVDLEDLASNLNGLPERSQRRFLSLLDTDQEDSDSGGLFRGSSGEGISLQGHEARIRALEMLQARARFPGKNQNLSSRATWTVGTTATFSYDDIGLEYGFMPISTYEDNVGSSEQSRITSITIDNSSLSLTSGVGRARYVIDNVNTPLWTPFVYVGKCNKLTIIEDVIAASSGTASAIMEIIPLDRETRDAVLAALGDY